MKAGVFMAALLVAMMVIGQTSGQPQTQEAVHRGQTTGHFIPECEEKIPTEKEEIIYEGLKRLQSDPRDTVAETEYNQGPTGTWTVAYTKLTTESGVYYAIGLLSLGESDLGTYIKTVGKFVTISLSTSPPMHDEIQYCKDNNKVIVQAGPEGNPLPFLFVISAPNIEAADCLEKLPPYVGKIPNDDTLYAIIPLQKSKSCIV